MTPEELALLKQIDRKLNGNGNGWRSPSNILQAALIALVTGSGAIMWNTYETVGDLVHQVERITEERTVDRDAIQGVSRELQTHKTLTGHPIIERQFESMREQSRDFEQRLRSLERFNFNGP